MFLRDIADPLFAKQCRFSNTPHYENNSCTKNADWFDTECTEVRSVYVDALRVFNALKTPDSIHDLCTKKLHNKSLLHKKKSAYYRLKMYEIENLKKSNPKQFWQYVKANKRQNQSNDQFKTFFSNISYNTEDCNNNKAETFHENHDFNCLNDKSPELDNPMTIDEMKNAINSLKCGKAFGNDCI